MFFVDGIVQDVSGEFAFVLFQVGEDLLGEFFSGGGQGSFAWRQSHAGEGVFITDRQIGGDDGTLAGARQLLGILAGFRVHVLVNGGEAAEKKIADVGEDGSAAGEICPLARSL